MLNPCHLRKNVISGLLAQSHAYTFAYRTAFGYTLRQVTVVLLQVYHTLIINGCSAFVLILHIWWLSASDFG